MRVRAGASDRPMAELMGVRVGRIFNGVFLLGAALAALAGALMGPIVAVQVGMGEAILIPALVVLVIGGIGSVRGAFVAALLVGVVDTVGRAFVPMLLRATLPPATAADLGPLFAEVAMYALMVVTSPSRYIGLGLLLVLLAAFPLIAPLFGLEFYIGFVRRVLIVALAAASLNFILGFGGMVALITFVKPEPREMIEVVPPARIARVARRIASSPATNAGASVSSVIGKTCRVICVQ
eukprot:gene57656-78996_t